MKPKENILRAIQRNNPEWIPNGMEHVFRIYPPIQERPYNACADAWGVQWGFHPEAEGGTYPLDGQFQIKDISSWMDDIQVPDVHSYDWSKVTEQVQTIDREDYLVEGFVEMGVFERSYLLFGMENALVNYMIDTDAMAEVASRIADYKIEFIRKFHEAAQLDIVWYGDDWGTQTNLFMPPEIWRETIKPHTQRIYDAMKELGIIINQHSCGKIDSIFEDICDMGADMWNSCQPCNDLKGLKERFGDRICFFGGIDSQHVLNRAGVTAEEVRQEVRLRIDEMSENGGYIAGPSHSIPYDPELIDAMNNEIQTYGRY
ncbi:MAG: hypothetical protein B6241_09785 [Spirochaetaceae bacterium 4572_59]|nr:MAG: hypothetical protein B6241_09785 [Spirochaetaceae bacterium 4572_59]